MGFGESFANSYYEGQSQQIQRAQQAAQNALAQQQLDRQSQMDEFTRSHQTDVLNWQKQYQQQQQDLVQQQRTDQAVHDVLGTITTTMPWMGPQNAIAAGRTAYEMIRSANPKVFSDDFDTFMQNHILKGQGSNGTNQPSQQASMPWDQTSMPQAQAQSQQGDGGASSPMAGMMSSFANQSVGPQSPQGGAQQSGGMPPGMAAILGGAGGGVSPGMVSAMGGGQPMSAPMPWEQSGMPQSGPPETGQMPPGMMPPGMEQGGSMLPPALTGQPGPVDPAQMAAAMGFDPNSMGIRGQGVQSQIAGRNSLMGYRDARLGQFDDSLALAGRRADQRDEALAMQKQMNGLKSPILQTQAKLLSEQLAAFQGNNDLKQQLMQASMTHLQNMDQLAQYGSTLKGQQFARSIQADEFKQFGEISRVSQQYQTQIDGNKKLISQVHGTMAKLMAKPDANDPNSGTAMEIARLSAQATQLAGENDGLKQQLGPVKDIADTMLENLKDNGLITDATNQWTPPAPKITLQNPGGGLPGISGTSFQGGPPAPGAPSTDLSKLSNQQLINRFSKIAQKKLGQ